MRLASSFLQFLEPAVLGFQRLQALRVSRLHATVLGAPLVERRIAESVLAAQIGNRPSRLDTQNS